MRAWSFISQSKRYEFGKEQNIALASAIKVIYTQGEMTS